MFWSRPQSITCFYIQPWGHVLKSKWHTCKGTGYHMKKWMLRGYDICFAWGKFRYWTLGKVKVKLSLCFNGAPRHEGVFFDLGTRWRWVVSFTPRRFTPWYPLDRRLGGPQSRSGRGVKEKNSQPPPRESNPRTPIVQPVAQRYTDLIQEWMKSDGLHSPFLLSLDESCMQSWLVTGRARSPVWILQAECLLTFIVRKKTASFVL
jgi:hypothetical protein